jgi:hypothetical protein
MKVRHMDAQGKRNDAGPNRAGEYGRGDEGHGISPSFTAEEVAKAFGVEVARVHRAMQGEFQLAPDALVDSHQARELAEVLLSDKPLDKWQAALMELGAYTPRFDEIEGTVSEKPPGEQSDRIRPSEEVPDIGAPREDT